MRLHKPTQRLIITFVKVVLIAWVYGTKPFLEDIKSMGLYTNRYNMFS